MKRTERCYGKALQVSAVAKSIGVSEDIVSAVYDEIFKVITDNVMKCRTVQVPGFGNFKLKHLGRRAAFDWNTQTVSTASEEHLKITFMAYADVARRLQRKLNRQKAREEEKTE